jgi:hypothetical protein
MLAFALLRAGVNRGHRASIAAGGVTRAAASFGNVGGDAPHLVAGEQLSCGASSRLVLEIDAVIFKVALQPILFHARCHAG